VDQCDCDELEQDPEVKDDADDTDMNDMVCAQSIFDRIEGRARCHPSLVYVIVDLIVWADVSEC
jgi:hypothetical protein